MKEVDITSQSKISIKWKENYLSQSLNRSFYGIRVSGVYRGFLFDTYTWNDNGTLKTGFKLKRDDVYADSIAVYESPDKLNLYIQVLDDIIIWDDLNNGPVLGAVYHFFLKGNYTVGQDTTASILAVEDSEYTQDPTLYDDYVNLGYCTVNTTIAETDKYYTTRYFYVFQNQPFQNKEVDRVKGELFLDPNRTVELSYDTNGLVTQVLVKEGSITRIKITYNNDTTNYVVLSRTFEYYDELGRLVDSQTENYTYDGNYNIVSITRS